VARLAKVAGLARGGGFLFRQQWYANYGHSRVNSPLPRWRPDAVVSQIRGVREPLWRRYDISQNQADDEQYPHVSTSMTVKTTFNFAR
jgi:hypothetical protein